MKLGTIKTTSNITTIAIIPNFPTNSDALPSIIPKTPKSKSPKVVFWNPNEPSTGKSNAGAKVIKSPFTNEPTIAP